MMRRLSQAICLQSICGGNNTRNLGASGREATSPAASMKKARIPPGPFPLCRYGHSDRRIARRRGGTRRSAIIVYHGRCHDVFTINFVPVRSVRATCYSAELRNRVELGRPCPVCTGRPVGAALRRERDRPPMCHPHTVERRRLDFSCIV